MEGVESGDGNPVEYPESREWNPESKDLLEYLTWGESEIVRYEYKTFPF